jgi:hypothetical protein
MIDSTSGRIAKPASSFDGDLIQSGTKVLIIQVENGVLQVTVHHQLESFL